MKIKNIIYLLFLIAGFACENDGINQENLEQVQSKSIYPKRERLFIRHLILVRAN